MWVCKKREKKLVFVTVLKVSYFQNFLLKVFDIKNW